MTTHLAQPINTTGLAQTCWSTTDPTSADRFLSKVDRTGGCWLWMASTNNCGYGFFWFRGKMRGAHRVAYQIFCGEIPDGIDVLHRCDKPSCVNPEHLFLGTRQDNMDDMTSKGRQSRGETHVSSKLTAAQVNEIRTRYVRGNSPKLAVEFGVNQTSICNVIAGRTWRNA